MIAIVPSGSPMDAAFYSVYSEAETLILFSRFFPNCKDDLFLFQIPDDATTIRRAAPYKLIKYKYLHKLNDKL